MVYGTYDFLNKLNREILDIQKQINSLSFIKEILEEKRDITLKNFKNANEKHLKKIGILKK